MPHQVHFTTLAPTTPTYLPLAHGSLRTRREVVPGVRLAGCSEPRIPNGSPRSCWQIPKSRPLGKFLLVLGTGNKQWNERCRTWTHFDYVEHLHHELACQVRSFTRPGKHRTDPSAAGYRRNQRFATAKPWRPARPLASVPGPSAEALSSGPPVDPAPR